MRSWVCLKWTTPAAHIKKEKKRKGLTHRLLLIIHLGYIAMEPGCYETLQVSRSATREEIISGWRKAKTREKNTARHGILWDAKEKALGLLEQTARALEVLKSNRVDDDEAEDFEQYYRNLAKIKSLPKIKAEVGSSVMMSQPPAERPLCAFEVLWFSSSQPVKTSIKKKKKKPTDVVRPRAAAPVPIIKSPASVELQRTPLHDSPFLKKKEKECVKEFMAFARGHEGGLHRLKQVSANILAYHDVPPEQLNNIASFAGLYVDGNTGDYRRVRKAY
jgi:hypothetical protein